MLQFSADITVTPFHKKKEVTLLRLCDRRYVVQNWK